MKENVIKVSLFLILILFVGIVLFNTKVIGANGTINSRASLIKAPHVGETISLCMHQTHHDAALYQWDNNHHIYCIQHNADVQDGLYRVEAYVKIEGNLAKATVWNR